MQLSQTVEIERRKIRTEKYLTSKLARVKWQRRFRVAPELANARFYADQPELGHAWLGFQTMAGWFNDATGGFMLAEEARDIYLGE